MTAPFDKHELRVRMRAQRKRLAELDPEAATRAAEHADALPDAGVVAVYCAVGSELGMEPLSRALERLGRTLCLPVVVQRDAAMIFRRWSPGEPLGLDEAGMPAPSPLGETITPELILTPLLAFDARGGRLGQGGGYYDRTFAALPKVHRIGFAYAGQGVQRLPLEEHDIRLDSILTEQGYNIFNDISR